DAGAVVTRRGNRAPPRAVGLRGPVHRSHEGRVAVGFAPLRGIRRVMRALRGVRAQLRASIATALQYRFEFAVEGALALLWMGVTLVPLIVVFGTRETVAGWTFPEMLVVLGWFVALKGILEGTLSPSLLQVIEHVRKGTLDFVLLKPADAQLLVSLSKIEPWRMIDVAGAAVILVVAFQRIGRPPALMTTYPSPALLGKMNLRAAVGAVAGTLLFAAVARGIWIVSIRRYTSASS